MLYTELRNQGIPIVTNYQIKGIIPYQIDIALFVNGNRYAIEMREEQMKTNKKKLYADRWKIRSFSEQDIQNNLDYVIEEIKRFC